MIEMTGEEVILQEIEVFLIVFLLEIYQKDLMLQLKEILKIFLISMDPLLILLLKKDSLLLNLKMKTICIKQWKVKMEQHLDVSK